MSSSKNELPNGRNTTNQASCRLPASSRNTAERCEQTVTEQHIVRVIACFVACIHAVPLCWLLADGTVQQSSEHLSQQPMAANISAVSVAHTYMCIDAHTKHLSGHRMSAAYFVTHDHPDAGGAANIQKLGVGAGIRSCQTAG